MHLHFVIAVVALIFASFNALLSVPNIADISNEEKLSAIEEVTMYANNFSLNIYKIVTSAMSTANSPLSTYGIFSSLCAAALGASEDNKKQIDAVLKFSTNDRRSIAGFMGIHNNLNKISDNPDETIFMTNHLKSTYYQTFEPKFESIAHDVYNVEIQRSSCEEFDRIAFTAVTRIECYLPRQRNKDSLIFFTRDQIFSPSKTIKSTLLLTGEHRYGELPEIDAEFVEISCMKQNDPSFNIISIFIVFPKQLGDFGNIERNIGKISMRRLFSARLHNVRVLLPEVDLFALIDVHDQLATMGLTKVFSGRNEFDNIATNVEMKDFNSLSGLKILEISGTSSLPPSTNFTSENVVNIVIDRPFLTIVTTTGNNPLILQIGRYVGN